ncbi:MAG: copper uptake system-associated protein, partial [Hyphomicrobium sp.]
GRALLKRRGHGWSVILCSGDGIKSAAGLTAAGLPAAVAQEMEMALSRAEATLPAHVVARFSLFEGSVPVENGAHADHHKH